VKRLKCGCHTFKKIAAMAISRIEDANEIPSAIIINTVPCQSNNGKKGNFERV